MADKSKNSYMQYVHLGLKIVSLVILYAIFVKVDEIYNKAKKEGFTRFNTQQARPQRQQVREKFSVMNPEMDNCMDMCKANDWTVQGSDLSPDAQCELQCSRFVNYTAESGCKVGAQ
jgi:hypothetical protein